jgi:hypothetical protein
VANRDVGLGDGFIELGIVLEVVNPR